jgi:hypothetical protein
MTATPAIATRECWLIVKVPGIKLDGREFDNALRTIDGLGCGHVVGDECVCS